MAPSARTSQQEMSHFLSKVESDLRELTRRQQRAQEDGSRWQEVQVVLTRLQQHREQIRQRSSAKSIDRAAQSKLAAARSKIEEGMRKAKELEKRCRVDSSQQPASLSTSAMSSPGSASASPSPSRSTQRCDSSLSSVSATVPAESEADQVEEVKVLAEQLVADVASGEGGDVASEFVCKICQTHVVGCQPKLTSCSHLFCGDCLSKWFAAHPSCQSWAGRAKGAGSVPCPVCKEPLHADKDLHPVCKGGQGGSAFLWQMLSSTRIVCANHPKCNKEGRCDWEGDYGSYQQHICSCTNEPGHARVLPSSLPHGAEVVEAPAAEISAGSDVSEEPKSGAIAETFSDTSCTASSFGEGAATTSETESEAEDTASLPDTLQVPARENSEFESDIEDVSGLGCMVEAPAAEVNALEPAAASEQGADLYSLIAQLVELKASSAPVQAQQQPSSMSTPASLEVSPAPQISEPMPVQGKAPETRVPQELPAAKPSSKIGGGTKPAAKSKDTKTKHSRDSATAAQLNAQAADLRSMQMQARVAQAAQAAYTAQWQAAWQMQAAQAMQMQQAGMAYAGRMAQWQLAQKQAAQAAWAMQAARR